MNETSENVLTELPSLLSWRGGESLLDRADHNHGHWMWSRLRMWAATTDRSLWDEVVALPKQRQRRLLFSPEVFRLFSTYEHLPSPAALAALRSYISVEYSLAEGRPTIHGHEWSALADYRSPAVTPHSDELGKAYHAPAIGSVIIDAVNPHDLRMPGANWSQMCALDLAERPDAVSHIQQAFALIAETSSTAQRTVERGPSVILLKKLPDDERQHASSSWRMLIGLVALGNAQSPTWTVAGLADAIVHESIHQAMYKLELTQPTFADMDKATKFTTTSPWTGKTLTLTQFTHACFVWFGLYAFWSVKADVSQAARFFRDRARRGFDSGSPLDHIGPVGAAAIDSRAREAINRLYEQVSAST